MRLRSHAVWGLAVFLAGITGCAVARYPGDSKTPPITSYRQYGLSDSPYQPVRPGQDDTLGAKPQEFDFSHPGVDDYVTRFQTDLRGFFTHALLRSGRYVPRMSSILEKEGLPQGLAYLPLIESGFRPLAVSHAGAVGPWQLVRGTGRRYGLRIDRYVDERRDPVKSTKAAAKYLKDLYAMFGDWHLSLAAYNTGEGNIARILQQGRADDFWQMRDRGYLHRETEEFVPRFLAALQIAEEPEAYGFDAPTGEPAAYDMVTIKRSLSLTTVARLSGATVGTIKELNPALRRGVVPPRGYAVRLPEGSKQTFQVAYANLRSRKVRVAKKSSGAATDGLGAGTYRVRHGETIASIARAHRVSVKALMQANRIHNPRSLQIGQVLRLPMVTAQATGGHGARTHRVRRGETIASIARAHRVSVKALMRANGIRNPRRLQIGRVLQLPTVTAQAKQQVRVADSRARARARVLD